MPYFTYKAQNVSIQGSLLMLGITNMYYKQFLIFVKKIIHNAVHQ